MCFSPEGIQPFLYTFLAESFICSKATESEQWINVSGLFPWLKYLTDQWDSKIQLFLIMISPPLSLNLYRIIKKKPNILILFRKLLPTPILRFWK
jgi:hypothetical protein